MAELTDKTGHTVKKTKSQTEIDHHDLNSELSGMNCGKQKYFFPDKSPEHQAKQQKKQAREREFYTMLDMLLAKDPIYAELYEQVSQKLEKAQQAVDLALIDINQRLEASDRKLQFLRDNAAELEDGTKAFKSNHDNSIYTEHGKRLDREKAKHLRFSEHSPSWENYQAEKQAYDTATRQKQEVEAYQRNVLDPIEERLQDKGNPALHDELKKMKAPIEDAMPNILQSKYNQLIAKSDISRKPTSSVAHSQVEETKLNVPDMNKSFDLARIDIPDFGSKPESQNSPSNTHGV